MLDHRHNPWDSRLKHDIPVPPLVSGICTRCSTTGIWLTPMGIVAECPNLMLKYNDHPPMNDAAEKVLHAGRNLARREIIANPIQFAVARALTHFSTTDPAPRQELMDKHFSYSKSGRLREFHSAIEQLRRVWLLPVASRKNVSAGYWIATTQHDFAEWFDRTGKAPRTQLQTIFRLAKHNWPVYGEQIELDFWSDMGESVPDEAEPLKAPQAVA